MIFLELVPYCTMFVLSKNCSERSGSFFLYSNDLRIAVGDCCGDNVNTTYCIACKCHKGTKNSIQIKALYKEKLPTYYQNDSLQFAEKVSRNDNFLRHQRAKTKACYKNYRS